MTLADEIESLIRKSIDQMVDISSNPYELTTMRNIYIMKFPSFYAISLNRKHYSQKDEFDKIYDQIGTALANRKILIKNKMLDTNRIISLVGRVENKTITIFYENCVFANSYPYINLEENCENSIVEGT